MSSTYFITGIDTGIGKTIITGFLAKYFLKKNFKTITHKLVQTGCNGISEDILEHRRIMNTEIYVEDKNGLTCPYVFAHPCSPHLAARMENKTIDPLKLRTSIEELQSRYDVVLIEGAGGLYVPLNGNYKIIDFISENNYPVFLVTGPKLGSINHTLMSLEILKIKNIQVDSVIMNNYMSQDDFIEKDSEQVFRASLMQLYPDSVFTVVKNLKDSAQDVDFKLYNN